MDHQLSLSLACEGFTHYKKATGKSPDRILDCQTTLNELRVFFKDIPPPPSLTREKLVSFLDWLQDGYLAGPYGVAHRGRSELAPKSINNIHSDLSPFGLGQPRRGL